MQPVCSSSSSSDCRSCFLPLSGRISCRGARSGLGCLFSSWKWQPTKSWSEQLETSEASQRLTGRARCHRGQTMWWQDCCHELRRSCFGVHGLDVEDVVSQFATVVRLRCVLEVLRCGLDEKSNGNFLDDAATAQLHYDLLRLFPGWPTISWAN